MNRLKILMLGILSAIVILSCTSTQKQDLSDAKVAALEDSIYYPSDSILKLIAASKPDTLPVVELTKEERIAKGEALYGMICVSCHQMNGQGLPGTFPPLAASDYFGSDINKAIHVLKNGLSGEVTVNGNIFNNVMPKLDLKDEDIASVLTYVMNNWGNSGAHVTSADVRNVN